VSQITVLNAAPAVTDTFAVRYRSVGSVIRFLDPKTPGVGNAEREFIDPSGRADRWERGR
jgi:hypothetical protein